MVPLKATEMDPLSSGSQKPEIKVLAKLLPSGGLREKLVECFPWVLSGSCWQVLILWLIDGLFPLCFFLSLSLSVSVSRCHLHSKTLIIWDLKNYIIIRA